MKLLGYNPNYNNSIKPRVAFGQSNDLTVISKVNESPWNKPIVIMDAELKAYKVKENQINNAISSLFIKEDVRKLQRLIKDVKDIAGLTTEEVSQKSGLGKRALEQFFGKTKNLIRVNDYSFYETLFDSLKINISDENKKILSEKLLCFKNSGRVFLASDINTQKQKIIDMIPFLDSKEEFNKMGQELDKLLIQQGKTKVYLASKVGVAEKPLTEVLLGKSLAHLKTYQNIFNNLDIELNEKQMNKFSKKLLVISKGKKVLNGEELANARREMIGLIDNVQKRKDVVVIRDKIKSIAKQIGIGWQEMDLNQLAKKKVGKIETLNNALNKIGVFLNAEQQSSLNKKWAQLYLNGFVPSSEQIEEVKGLFIKIIQGEPNADARIKAGASLSEYSKLEGVYQHEIATGLSKTNQYISRLFVGRRTTKPEMYLKIFEFIKNKRF